MLHQQYNLLAAPVLKKKSGEVWIYVPEREEDGDAGWVGLLNGKKYKPRK